VTDGLDGLRARGSLQDVETDDTAAARLLEDARLHLRTARTGLDAGDLAGAYQLAYDAARKSLTALLLSNGLRVRGVGAHVALIDACRGLFGDAPGIDSLDRLDRMRRTRNQAEYLGRSFDRDEVLHDLATAEAVVAFVEGVLGRR
jgi:HEPN domain-containing protein